MPGLQIHAVLELSIGKAVLDSQSGVLILDDCHSDLMIHEPTGHKAELTDDACSSLNDSADMCGQICLHFLASQGLSLAGTDERSRVLLSAPERPRWASQAEDRPGSVAHSEQAATAGAGQDTRDQLRLPSSHPIEVCRAGGSAAARGLREQREMIASHWAGLAKAARLVLVDPPRASRRLAE